jgi:hypothetical protein
MWAAFDNWNATQETMWNMEEAIYASLDGAEPTEEDLARIAKETKKMTDSIKY